MIPGIYTPAQLKQMDCRHGCDTIDEESYKSLWVDKKGNVYKCTHSSQAKTDEQGRDILDKHIVSFRY